MELVSNRLNCVRISASCITVTLYGEQVCWFRNHLPYFWPILGVGIAQSYSVLAQRPGNFSGSIVVGRRFSLVHSDKTEPCSHTEVS